MVRGAAATTKMAAAGMRAPATPFNVEIGPHRRFQMTQTELADLKRVKDAHGGTVNDVILSIVSGAIGRYLRARGHDTEGMTLRALVPVSIREAEEHGALGNRISAMMAPLPVWCEDPVERLHIVTEEMGDLKASGQAVGAEILTRLTDFAPTTIVSQAARLQPAQRFFNLVVTNVPGPQFPLYVLGRQMESIFPMVPLARKQALCIGIMSYNGQVNFGLIGDYDAMADLDSFALDLEAATAEAIATAPPARRPPKLRRRRRATAPRPSAPSATIRPLTRNGVVFGQVAPVEVAGAVARGARVGVDDDRGDPLEARRVGEGAVSVPPAGRVGDRFDRAAVAFGADPPDQRQPRRPPLPALRPSLRPRARWAAWTPIRLKVVWLRRRVDRRRAERPASPGAACPGRGSSRGSRSRCATRRRRRRSG